MKTIWWIIVGYFNLLKSNLKMLNKKKRELYNHRLDICLKCDHRYKEFCEICGCYIKAKTKVDKASCPKEYW
jgi:rRNA maturation endonuclease Nob1